MPLTAMGLKRRMVVLVVTDRPVWGEDIDFFR
jgi:hypothetical protein